GVIDNAEVNYQLSCDNGGYQYYSADMSTATLSSGGAAVTSIDPGLQYRIDVAGTNCGATSLGVNEEATLWIHVNGGGSTYEKIYISNTAHGSQVI
ncbi:MAG: hypothetical protein QF817_06570, partial [Candidatus Poseidoniaceae archaeon]|nr:hypothetical protein [Candidatus Poseidoniaceae archaeon]